MSKLVRSTVLTFFLLTALPLGPISLLAHAAQKSGETGTLVSNQTATGTTTNCINANGALCLALLFSGTAGTLSVKTQVCMDSKPYNCDQNSTWVDVVGSTLTTTPSVIQIANPLGCYRVNFGTCTGCNVNVNWQAR